ncbi:hypothetical protein OTU49_010861 [Cherax quadricarinatus]|uniref:Uncharacterized protein n=1 Tax=Cherax quadricarinatus TaxID=27406 RepID=A0AAW0W7N6_CHEQU
MQLYSCNMMLHNYTPAPRWYTTVPCTTMLHRSIPAPRWYTFILLEHDATQQHQDDTSVRKHHDSTAVTLHHNDTAVSLHHNDTQLYPCTTMTHSCTPAPQ